MRGVLYKSIRESWGPTLLIGLGFAIVGVLFNLIIPNLQQQLLGIWEQLPIVKLFVSALMGVQITGETSGHVFMTIIWTHPIVLALLWAHEIIHCTRFPAAEIDRGTIDLTLALPVSRAWAYGAESIVWLGSGLVVILIGLTGVLIGSSFVAPGQRVPAAALARIVANLVCLYAAVGGVAMMVSAASSRRGRAIGIILAIVLASFFWTFLAPFWKPAEATSFLSVLSYYRPAQIVLYGRLGWRDPAVLLTIGAVGWSIGLLVLSRRDIATT